MSAPQTPESPTPRLTRAEILRRLEAGEDFEIIAQSRLSPEAQAVMRRASLARELDAELFERVLAEPGSGGAGVTLGELERAGAIEAVRGAPGHFRVPEEQRLTWLRGWFPADARGALPQEIADAGRKLVAFFEAKGEAGQIALLHHAALVDPPRARRLFAELYDAADRSFDRARCTDVLRAVDEGNSLRAAGVSLVAGDPELSALYADRSHYLDARCFWADDFYATGRTLARPALDAAFERLLADAGPWAMALWARGGMGKTTFLRWAIARRCVPAPARIPCARFDFDHAGGGGDAHATWRVYLHFAEQLDPQLTGAPFSGLIDVGRRLRETGIRDAAELAVGAGLVRRFGQILRSVAADRRVLLVLDTCEEAALHQTAAFAELLDELRKLHGLCGSVRLVLSGRYDLRKQLPEVCARFGEGLESVRVKPLTKSEAARYLASRGIAASGPEKDPRARVAIRRAGGLPFKLALLADLIQAQPDLTAAEIEAYPSVDLAYLIERVVERIADGRVQWLLRYGVVPRRLTFAFVRDVMARELPEATAGRSTKDDATKGLPVDKRGKVFPTGAGVALPASPDEATMRGLWDHLRQYASNTSWVTAVGTETLAFHADVLEPMRDLLRQNDDAFVALHRAAQAHWERRGVEVPAERAAGSREVVYHLFQLHLAAAQRAARMGAEPPKADEVERAWFAEMACATAAGDAGWQHGLAEEVTRPPFVDEKDRPAEHAPATLVAHAWLVRARAALELNARAGEPDPRRWAEAERCLNAIGQLPDQVRRGLSELSILTARAHLLLGRGDAGGAVRELESAARLEAEARLAAAPDATHGDEPDGVGMDDVGMDDVRVDDVGASVSADVAATARAERTWATALLALERSDAIEHAERAERAALEAGFSADARTAALFLHADALAAGGKQRAARELLARVLAEPVPEVDRVEAVLRDARVALAMGDGGSVLAAVSELRRGASGETAVAAHLVEAEILRQGDDLNGALERCDGARRHLKPFLEGSGTPPRAVRRLDAQLAESRGLIHADALDLEPAHGLLEAARSAWESLGEVAAAARCRAHDLTISVVEEGDREALARMLQRDNPTPGAATPSLAAALGLWVSDPPSPLRTEAARMALQLARELPPRALPATRAATALALLSFEPTDAGGQGLLARALSDIDSPEGGLEALLGIERVPAIVAPLPELRAALERLLPLADEKKSPGYVRRVLRLVDVLRVLDRADDGVLLLQLHAVGRRSVESWTPHLAHLRAGLAAADRLGAEAAARVLTGFPDRVHPHAVVQRSPRFGALRTIVLLEQGERLLRVGRPREAAEVVTELAGEDAQRGWPAPWRTRLASILAPRTSRARPPQPAPVLQESPPIVPPALRLESLPVASPVESLPVTSPERRTLWIDGAGKWSAAVTGGAVPRLSLDNALPELRTLDRIMDRIMRPRSRRLADETVERLTEEWSVIAPALGKELEAVVHACVGDRTTFLLQAIDLALRLWGWRAAAIPWELVRIPVAPQLPLGFLPNLRALFRPATEAAERLSRQSLPHAETAVLLLQPRAEIEQRAVRGMGSGATEEAYVRRGLRVERLDEPTLDDLFRAISARPRAVLHLRGVLREAADGDLVWGFQPFLSQRESYRSREAEIDAAALARLFEKFDLAQVGTLVVLDPLPASSPRETTRQLLLRNRFAAELRAHTSSPPVLGMGLARSAGWGALDALAVGAAEHLPVFQVASNVRRALFEESPSSLNEIPSSLADETHLAVALFCDDPDQHIGGDDA